MNSRLEGGVNPAGDVSVQLPGFTFPGAGNHQNGSDPNSSSYLSATSVELTGNQWRSLAIPTEAYLPGAAYQVTEDTVLSFDVKITNGENAVYIAIGVGELGTEHRISRDGCFYGLGGGFLAHRLDMLEVFDEGPILLEDGWCRYSISLNTIRHNKRMSIVTDFARYPLARYIHLVMDDNSVYRDASFNSRVSFRHVRLYENSNLEDVSSLYVNEDLSVFGDLYLTGDFFMEPKGDIPTGIYSSGHN